MADIAKSYLNSIEATQWRFRGHDAMSLALAGCYRCNFCE